ncbi:MAG: hypothetical protein ACLTK0_08295 [Anaerovoracaceae bacterium]
MQERAAKFADKEIRRKTYQAMEALIHNLNTMIQGLERETSSVP